MDLLYSRQSTKIIEINEDPNVRVLALSIKIAIAGPTCKHGCTPDATGYSVML